VWLFRDKKPAMSLVPSKLTVAALKEELAKRSVDIKVRVLLYFIHLQVLWADPKHGSQNLKLKADLVKALEDAIAGGAAPAAEEAPEKPAKRAGTCISLPRKDRWDLYFR
jgi:hypothetical protein